MAPETTDNPTTPNCVGASTTAHTRLRSPAATPARKGERRGEDPDSADSSSHGNPEKGPEEGKDHISSREGPPPVSSLQTKTPLSLSNNPPNRSSAHPSHRIRGQNHFPLSPKYHLQRGKTEFREASEHDSIFSMQIYPEPRPINTSSIIGIHSCPLSHSEEVFLSSIP